MELFIVLTIISVITGLATLVAHKANDSARDTRCVSNLRQIGTTILAYAADHGGKIPLRSTAEDRTSWQTRLQPYFVTTQKNLLRKGFNCPAAEVQPNINDSADNRTTYGITVYGGQFDQNLLKVTETPILLVVDMPTANVDTRGPWNDGRTTLPERREMFRHKGHTAQNGVFTDGHVESMKPSRAGVYLPDGSASAWLPSGFSFRYAGYWITPTPPAPTDNIE